MFLYKYFQKEKGGKGKAKIELSETLSECHNCIPEPNIENGLSQKGLMVNKAMVKGASNLSNKDFNRLIEMIKMPGSKKNCELLNVIKFCMIIKRYILMGHEIITGQ